MHLRTTFNHFVRKPGPLKLVDALLFEGQTLCRISVSQLKLRQIICHMVARVSCHPSTTNGLTEASIPKFCRCGLDLARVVQTLDSAIHRINRYPADSVIDLRNTYPLDSDLSGG